MLTHTLPTDSLVYKQGTFTLQLMMSLILVITVKTGRPYAQCLKVKPDLTLSINK